jgi:gas vesicle protein
MDDHNNGSRFISSIAWIGIGALTGVLCAPRSGKKTRQPLLCTPSGVRPAPTTLPHPVYV